MRLRFFAVPALAAAEAEAELNRFLAERRVVAVDRQLVSSDGAAYWAVCVSYLDGAGEGQAARRGKIDYKEVLSAPEFAVFARLRALRKELAERDGVPAYALFTNEQLAAMVTRRIRAAGALADLPGVGPARVEKYGQAFLDVLRQTETERAETAVEQADE
jgi:superfamily II DNA helicase RecQ